MKRVEGTIKTRFARSQRVPIVNGILGGDTAIVLPAATASAVCLAANLRLVRYPNRLT